MNWLIAVIVGAFLGLALIGWVIEIGREHFREADARRRSR